MLIQVQPCVYMTHVHMYRGHADIDVGMYVRTCVCVLWFVRAYVHTYVHLLDVHICTAYTCAHVCSQAVDGILAYLRQSVWAMTGM